MLPGDRSFAFAAYKMGAFKDVDVVFEEDHDPEMFKLAFAWWAHANYGVFQLNASLEPSISTVGTWTVESVSSRNVREPVGLIVGWVRGRVVQVGEMIWYPWATNRNRIEGAVQFFDTMRREFHVMDFAQMKDKGFFEMICRHGILRKVGHLHGLYPNGPAVLFETKELNNAN